MAKTHWKKTIDPDWIGAYVLPEGKPINVQLSFIETKKVKVKDKTEKHTIAHFHPNAYFNKPMLLNSTNMQNLTRLAKSPYVEDWKDIWVTLEQKWVKAFGNEDWALRISPVAPKTELPSLIKKDPQWDNITKYYAEGKVDMTYIEKKYKLTPEIKKEIELCKKEIKETEEK